MIISSSNFEVNRIPSPDTFPTGCSNLRISSPKAFGRGHKIGGNPSDRVRSPAEGEPRDRASIKETLAARLPSYRALKLAPVRRNRHLQPGSALAT
jgi:hypothetical protein